MSTVFLDVDTQLDFLFPAGALYVPGAERLLPTLTRLNRWALDHGAALISTLDTHSENDPEFRAFGYPAHCVRSTWGHSKPAGTLWPEQARVAVGQMLAALVPTTQVLLEKPTFNCFTNPSLGPLLEALSPSTVVVYGVVTEICVRAAALGLLELAAAQNYPARVELVTDAVQHLSEAKRDEFFTAFVARGGLLTTADEVCGRS